MQGKKRKKHQSRKESPIKLRFAQERVVLHGLFESLRRRLQRGGWKKGAEHGRLPGVIQKVLRHRRVTTYQAIIDSEACDGAWPPSKACRDSLGAGLVAMRGFMRSLGSFQGVSCQRFLARRCAKPDRVCGHEASARRGFSSDRRAAAEARKPRESKVIAKHVGVFP